MYSHRSWRRGRSGHARSPVRAGLAAVLVLGTLSVAAPSRADYWYEHYSRAETALENENWERAVEELQQALERKGDSGARVRWYGMKVYPYFPYLKLGIAYYHLGQFEAALQAFQTEEQLGAIDDSEPDLAELTRYRNLALNSMLEAARAEEERIDQIVRESLREAEILEGQDRLPEAMEALGRGLAVDPENPLATARMDELRMEVVSRERERSNAARARDLISRGRSLLADGDYSEASSLFRQALELRPGGEAQDLFDQARAGLLAELQAEEDEEARRQSIATGLTQARDFAETGRFAEALDRLQPVLAADPQNADALALQQRILEGQQLSADRKSLSTALAEARAAYADGDFEGAISAANLVLAIDPGNSEALSTVRDAYGQISRRLLGSRNVENLPPAIRFADFRTERDDGTSAQLVSSPGFRLSGVVIDASPVDVRFRGPGDREIEGSSTSQPMGEVYITEFSLDDELADGLSTYQLVATDNAGLSTSAEYMVVYSAPFYRSPVFKLALVLLPAVVLGAVWAQRVRRRRQLVQRRFNPYIAGAPVLESEMFFGRDQLIERILQTIHNNSLLLYGERRIGKTSLQHHLRRRLQQLDDPHYDFFPVYIDLQGTPEAQFFRTLAEDVCHELEPVLGGMQPGEGLPSDAVYGYRELVSDLRRVFKVLEERSSKRVKLVLLIDEVDELNAYDPRVNQRLRSLFMKSFAENLVAVVSGVEIRKQWDKEGSPWYNFFEEVEIKPIGRDHAVELITRPMEGVFKLRPEVIDLILDLTDCKPYRLQRLCIALVNRMYEEGRREITIADVDAVAGNDA